ncbi:MAG: tetratricopeptide repeat protein [Pseudomonadota bacterium]
MLAFLLGFLPALFAAPWGPGQALGQSRPGEVKPPLVLEGIRLGTLEGYSRLVFLFSQPVEKYEVKRLEVDELLIDLGPAQAQGQGRLGLSDQMVEGLAVAESNGNLWVKVKTKPTRYKFRHFSSPDGKSIVVDLQPLSEAEEAPVSAAPPRKGPYLEFPDARKIAKDIRERLPGTPKPETDVAQLASAMEAMAAGDFNGAALALETFKTAYSQSPLMSQVEYLLGDAYFNQAPDDFPSVFMKVTTAYQEALAKYPKSEHAARAAFLRAIAYQQMKDPGAEVGYLKLMLSEFPDSKYALLAKTFLADAYLDLDKPELAESQFQEVFAAAPQGPFLLKVYMKLGRYYFKEGLYSQANEVFKEILKQDDRFYLEDPSILYFMGEGYFHLGRMDLARAFLYHAINMTPKNEAADVMMARIGDSYKEQGRDQEAIKIYALTRRLYPDTIGALVSQMRLADYGSLRSLFAEDSIFTALEEGAQKAAIKLYQEVVDSKQDSPLVHLALFRIGNAYLNQGEYDDAIGTYREFLERFPKSSLEKDVLAAFNKALLEEGQNLLDQHRYFPFISFLEENKSHVGEDNWPALRTMAAEAYYQLNLPRKAAEQWEANSDKDVHEDQRLLGLGWAYLKLGRNEDALKILGTFLQKFRDHPQTAKALTMSAQAELAQGQAFKALAHLEQALSINPELARDLDFQKQMTGLYLQKGDYSRGVQAAQNVMAILKSSPNAPVEETFIGLARLGQIQAMLGARDQAVEALDQAMEIRPKDKFPDIIYLIAISYKKAGVMDQYKTTIQLLETSPDPFWREAAAQELKAMTPNKDVDKLLGKTS